MLIAPWMLPLRAAAFGILQGRLLLVGRALLTLLIGFGMTVVLSVLLGVSVGLPILGIPWSWCHRCAFGLLLAKAQWSEALGAALLFAANLLGIPSRKNHARNITSGQECWSRGRILSALRSAAQGGCRPSREPPNPVAATMVPAAVASKGCSTSDTGFH